jgi:hypothetical protein
MVKLTEGPMVEPTIEPMVELMVEPMVEPMVKLMVKLTVELMVKPMVELKTNCHHCHDNPAFNNSIPNICFFLSSLAHI